MYERFFNLKEKPFNLTPSSRFLYLGEAHKEALALLRYGVLERKGFILLTGEVGTGKTTMAQAFLGELDKRVHCIYLSNPLLTPQDLYNYLAFSAFKKRVIYKSKAAFILDFEGFLKERLKNQEVFILVIDEAQRLSYELLEEIRLLSNMETAEEKLINIFLIGQPELNKKLNDPRCRPLLQRISIRYHIKPLSLKETTEYLGTRLRVAGVDEMGKLFSKKVAEAIYEYSQGYPRVINILADNVLLLSFSKSERKIRPESVRQCYDDMKLEGSFLAKTPANGNQRESQKVVEIKTRRPKRLMFLILFLVLGLAGFLVGFEISDQGRAFMSRIETYLSENAQAWLVAQAKEKAADTVGSGESRLSLSPVERGMQVVDLPQPKVESVHKEETAEKATPAKAAVEKPAVEKTTLEKTVVAAVDNSSEAQPRKEKAAETAIKTVVAINPEKIESAQKEQSLGFISVKAGDTLIGLALKHYGRADGMILELLQERNPEIKNINRIEIGQRIYFPFLPAIKEEGKTFTVHIASFKPFENAQALFQRFMQEGYEAYLMPAYNPEKGKVHRITLGSFKTRYEGDAFAADILKKGIVGYAETILLEAR
jgi:type II secretory pathway predicted ATPase ExeA